MKDHGIAARLQALDDNLERARQQWSTPALAVCLADARGLVYQRAFGWADPQAPRPATTQTRFALASVTKSFAAMGALMLVREGRLSWDTPVRQLLPEFRLAAGDIERQATVRDLLGHRTGLPRHDALWFGSPHTRPSLLERLQHAAPSAAFRSAWQYQNLMVMTVGLIVERVTGLSWEQFTRQRILEPLGMARANFSIAEMQADADHALPFRVDRSDEPRPETYQNVDAIGAAGSLNGSIDDLGRWVQLLARQGAPLVDPPDFAELLQPDMRVPILRPWPEIEETHHGMGFFVTHYRGHALAHHGGNLPGASAMVALLPEHGVALGILTNVSLNGLRDALLYQLVDQVLGLPELDWNGRYLGLRAATRQAEVQGIARQAGLQATRRRDARSGDDASAEFVGRYANDAYGTLSLRRNDGGLWLDFNSFSSRLAPQGFEVFDTPDWEFTLGRTRLRMLRNVFGDLTGLEMHLEPSLPAIVFRREVEGGADEARFEGDYRLPGQRIQVRRFDGRLQWQALGSSVRSGLRRLHDARYAMEGSASTVVEFVDAGDDRGLLLQTPASALWAARES